jgi:4-amino-4-deoxy-L-arabinose transferase-like glycosyltransferase
MTAGPSSWRWTAPETGDWGRARVWVPLATLIVAYLVVQWSVLPPIHWGDTLRVFRYAASWPDVPTDHHALRIGLLLPTRLAQTLLGYGQAAFYTVAFAAGATLVVGTYVAGRVLFGRFAAIVATLAMLTSPYVVDTERFLTSGLILPDLPSAAVFTLGVGLLVHALQDESRRSQQVTLVLAGVALAGAYLIREFTPAMYVIVPLAFVLWRVPLRRMTWLVAPMLVIWGLEALTNLIVHGDSLIRLRVSSEHGGVLDEAQTAGDTFRLWLRAFTDSNRGQLLLVCLGLNVVGAAVFRDRRLVLTLAWFTSMFVALLALGGLLEPRSPSLRIVLTRYWFPVFPALVLGGVGTIVLAIEALSERGRTAAATALSVVTAAWLITTLGLPAVAQIATSERDRPWVELRAWLVEDGARHPVIYTDSRSDLMLDVYRYRTVGGERVWTGEIEEFDHRLADPPWDRVGGAPVLYAPQGPSDPPPASAEELFRSSDGSLVVVTVEP